MAKASPPKKPADSAPIMDVSRPGKSAPSPNSKSVIVTHRPMVADPMVTSDVPGAADVAPASKPADSPASKLKPLSAPPLAPDTEAAPEPEAAKPVEEPAKPEAEATPEPAAAEPTKPATMSHEKTIKPLAASETPAATEDKPETDAEPAKSKPAESDTPKPAEPAPVDDKTSASEPAAEGEAPSSDLPDPMAIEAARQAEHKAAIDKLVDGKQYYLPINSLEKRRTKRFIALGILLSLVLLVAWADIALDAGLVDVPGVKPVTHFFSN